VKFNNLYIALTKEAFLPAGQYKASLKFFLVSDKLDDFFEVLAFLETAFLRTKGG
jgi:hypothetical protein